MSVPLHVVYYANKLDLSKNQRSRHGFSLCSQGGGWRSNKVIKHNLKLNNKKEDHDIYEL